MDEADDGSNNTSIQSLPVDDDNDAAHIDDEGSSDSDQPNEAERVARTIIQHLLTSVQQRDSSSERSLPTDDAVGPSIVGSDNAEQEAQLLDVDSTASGEQNSTPDLFAEFCRIRLEQVAASVPSSCQSVRGQSRRNSNETFTEDHLRSIVVRAA